MEKRLFIAILVSFVVLIGWSKMAPKMFPELARQEEERVARQNAASKSAAPRPAAAPAPATPSTPVAAVSETRAQEIVVDHPQYSARLSNRGAVLTSFQLKDYKEKDGSLVDLVKKRSSSRRDYPFVLLSADRAWNDDINARLFRVERQSGSGIDRVTFTATDRNGRLIRKTFTFTDEYQFGFRAESSDRNLAFRAEVGPGIRTVDPAVKETQFARAGNGVVQIDGSLTQLQREKTPTFTPYDSVEFIGIEDNYFLAALKPTSGEAATLRTVKILSANKDEKPRHELYAGVNAAAGVVEAKSFFGPKKTDLLDKFGLSRAIHFGFFGPIAHLLLKALVYVYGFTKNYGWAIVVLTVIIKLLLYPLQHKSIVSMKRMQQVQPKMNAIKEKYRKAKTDPEQRQKMNVEMMALYQKEGISPVSGCLPILLQLPILWAFYALLSSAIELRGAPFIGWIVDLSEKDPYYITPILMTATMFIQQWITPSTVDPVQKRVFMIMPLIFGFIFKEFPSGLVLYWLVQNILTIIQQTIMNKYWNDHPEALKPSTAVIDAKPTKKR